jgi:dihydroorotate dehydrogenase electron transfer subunit
MGCGFGACLVCACKTKADDGEWQFSHVCKDGPIFNGRDVIF